MVKIITFCSFKGGTAKTSSVLNVADCFASFEKKKVLMLDFDPQSNLSVSLGCNLSSYSIMDVLQGNIDIQSAIQTTRRKDLFIIPSTSSLEKLSLCHSPASFKSLYQQLEHLLVSLSSFDFCFIDTPPSLGWISQMAFYASDLSIICVTPDPLSLIGLQKIKEYLSCFSGKKLHSVLGVIISMWDSRSSMNHMALDVIDNSFPKKSFATKIRRDICVSRAIIKQSPVCCVFPQSRAAKDYKMISKEILKRLQN